MLSVSIINCINCSINILIRFCYLWEKNGHLLPVHYKYKLVYKYKIRMNEDLNYFYLLSLSITITSLLFLDSYLRI